MSDQEKMEAMQLLTFSDVDMGMQNVGLARVTLQKTPSPKATHLPAMLFVAKYGSPTQAAVHFFCSCSKRQSFATPAESLAGEIPSFFGFQGYVCSTDSLNILWVTTRHMATPPNTRLKLQIGSINCGFQRLVRWIKFVPGVLIVFCTNFEAVCAIW